MSLIFVINPASPSIDTCGALLSHTNSVISELESVLTILYEVSSSPDEAMVLIRKNVETMLSEARSIQATLNSVKHNAAQVGFHTHPGQIDIQGQGQFEA